MLIDSFLVCHDFQYSDNASSAFSIFRCYFISNTWNVVVIHILFFLFWCVAAVGCFISFYRSGSGKIITFDREWPFAIIEEWQTASASRSWFLTRTCVMAIFWGDTPFVGLLLKRSRILGGCQVQKLLEKIQVRIFF